MDLTKKQRAVLDYIEKEIRVNGYPPTIREIGRAFSFSSTGSVRDYLKVLSEKKYIECIPGVSRGIRLLRKTGSIPVLGRIVAGKPQLAQENIEGEITVEGKLSGGGAFALKVKGDSMSGAGINEGDYVLVRPQSSCENNDIVVAVIEDEATVKRFRRRGGKLFLEPANPLYESFEIDEKVIIAGKVVGLVRYYV